MSDVASSAWSRQHPLRASVLENRPLNKKASAKDTRHIVLDLGSSGMTYHAGDSLGVIPHNSSVLVDELLQELGLTGDCPCGPGAAPLRQQLTSSSVINRAPKKLVRFLAQGLPTGSAKAELEAICADETKLADYIYSRDCVEVLRDYPGCRISAQEILDILPKAQPRLYSIASSPQAHPTQVHLTVACISYETHGRKKYGMASGYLAHHCVPGQTVEIFVQPTRHFHLPPDPSTPIIMVGPGTGIAPFRAFLQERKALGNHGPQWIFFGDQRASTDFLYQEEFEAALAEGSLTRLDTAFSRDQEKKIYVQDRMREQASLLWKWVSEGAYFYVCGDAKRMARDVHQTLIEISAQEGGMDIEAARLFVDVTMTREQKRYLKDIY